MAKSAKARREQLRRELLDSGMPVRQVAVKLADRLHVRPRIAWRYTMGWPQWKLVQEFRVANPHLPIGENRISEWESWPYGGSRPSLEVLAALADAFGPGCTVADLLDDADLERMSPAERRLVNAGRLGVGDTHSAASGHVSGAASSQLAPPQGYTSGTAIDDLCRVLTTYTWPDDADNLTPNHDPGQDIALAFRAFQESEFDLAAVHATVALGAAISGSGVPRSRALSYQVAAAVLSKTGHTDLAWVAADRGVAAARTLGNPDVYVSLLRTAAFSMAVSGRPATALGLIEDTAQRFQPEMTRSAVSASVYGTLLLAGAVVSAGQGDASGAATYLDEADQAATIVGGDSNELWTAFGPTNVAIHRANVAAASSDMDTVLKTGGSLHVDHMPTERRVRLHLDIARASLAIGDREDALATLVRAEVSAPSQVRHHHITKGVVSALVESATRRPGVELTRLAHAVGVPA